MRYNEKKRLQIAMRRLYSTNTPSKEIVSLLGTKDKLFSLINESTVSKGR